MQTLRELLKQHDHDGLVQLRSSLQKRIDEWRKEYDVDSPTTLREHAAETETTTETRDILDTASDWELLRYRLNIVEDAIENYETYGRLY